MFFPDLVALDSNPRLPSKQQDSLVEKQKTSPWAKNNLIATLKKEEIKE
jgi:hypothetical protein